MFTFFVWVLVAGKSVRRERGASLKLDALNHGLVGAVVAKERAVYAKRARLKHHHGHGQLVPLARAVNNKFGQPNVNAGSGAQVVHV